MPWDAAGEGVLQGQDPLCVAAVDSAIAQGQEPPAPVEAPASPAPSPSPDSSPSPTDEASDAAGGGLFGGGRPNIDPKILAAGAAALVTLTLLALFWKPVLAGIAWPFRKVAALPWRRPKPPRFVRDRRRNRRRMAASEAVEADPGAAKRADIAYLELRYAPAEIPARPVAVFATRTTVTVMVTADVTPPASSWRVLKSTIWRHSANRSATSAVRFDTTSHTEVGTIGTGTLVNLGIIERPSGGEQVFVDFSALRGPLAFSGHAETARDAVRVVAEGLHRNGVRTHVLAGRPLDSLYPQGAPEHVPPAPISAPGGAEQPRHAVIIDRPMSQDEEEALGRVPSGTLVVAYGDSPTAHWQWEAKEDGTLSTGPLGLTVVLRETRKRARQRAERNRRKRRS